MSLTERSVEELFERIPRRSPSDLVALAQAQGKLPLARFEDIFGLGAEEEEDSFDVDAFLAVRDKWRCQDLQRDECLADLDEGSE